MENCVLKLASEIESKTDGLCSVDIGPYGFGVDTDNSSEIDLMIRERPHFFPDIPNIPKYKKGTLSVEAYLKAEEVLLDQTALKQILKTSQNEATVVVAKATLELGKTTVHVTREEYESAYETLAEQQLSNSAPQIQMM